MGQSRDLKLQHIPMLTAFRQVPDHGQAVSGRDLGQEALQ
jgi:hypothetical protein